MNPPRETPFPESKTNRNNQERELLVRVSNGDETAFALLFDQYQNKVFSHALTYVKSVVDAEEIVSDIFLKVWQHRKKLPDIENFKNYLFILSRNQLISAVRKNVMEITDLSQDIWQDKILQPDEQYSQKETLDIIQKGIERLSPQQKKVFEMSRLQGLTYPEVAKALSISPRTVKFHIVLALNSLREYLRNRNLTALW